MITIRSDKTSIKLTSAEQSYDSIRKFRQTICAEIGLDVNGASVTPLPYAFYLLAFAGNSKDPVGMVEFFFYEQAFNNYSESVYNQAYHLSAIAPPHELVHARSMIITEPYRRTRLFLYLCGAMIQLAHHMGAQYLTASTGLDNFVILSLHSGAGASTGVFQGRWLRTIKHHIAIDIDSALAAELRARSRSQSGQKRLMAI